MPEPQEVNPIVLFDGGGPLSMSRNFSPIIEDAKASEPAPAPAESPSIEEQPNAAEPKSETAQDDKPAKVGRS